MTREVTLLLIQIIYPRRIALIPKSHFFIMHKKKKWSIHIDKHFSGLEIVDLKNYWWSQPIPESCAEGPIELRFEVPKKFERVLRVNGDIEELRDQHETYITLDQPAYTSLAAKSFTEIVLQVEVGSERSDPKFKLDGYVKNCRQVLAKWIQYYRAYSRDPSVVEPDKMLNHALVANYAAVKVIDETGQLTDEERFRLPRGPLKLKPLFAFISQPIEKKRSEEEVRTITSRIQEALKKEIDLPENIDVYMKALQEYSISENFKYCLLDCTIAIESMISNFLSKMKISAGVSPEKLKQFHASVDLAYKITIELPLYLKGENDATKKLIDDLEKLNSKRNRVVHQAEAVEKESADKALKAMRELARLLDETSSVEKPEAV